MRTAAQQQQQQQRGQASAHRAAVGPSPPVHWSPAPQHQQHQHPALAPQCVPGAPAALRAGWRTIPTGSSFSTQQRRGALAAARASATDQQPPRRVALKSEAELLVESLQQGVADGDEEEPHSATPESGVPVAATPEAGPASLQIKDQLDSLKAQVGWR